ncbi:MAG: hypothetical protein HWE14_02555 [Flavobacteriia bacterium]|nr:hypothetical protein [Flavobacteriia bacterium]
MKKTWLAIFAVAGMLVACNNAGSEGEETTPETEMQAENEGTEMEADHADHEDHADHADHSEDMSSEEPANEVEETMDNVEEATEKAKDNSDAMETEVREVQSGEGLSKRK